MIQVLLVDHQPLLLNVLKAYPDLIEVSVATDALQGWKMLRKEFGKFNLILVDKDLPGISGVDLLDKIKLSPELIHIPVIMTGECMTKKERTQCTMMEAIECIETNCSDAVHAKVQELIKIGEQCLSVV